MFHAHRTVGKHGGAWMYTVGHMKEGERLPFPLWPLPVAACARVPTAHCPWFGVSGCSRAKARQYREARAHVLGVLPRFTC
jgi:hypothetical protein